MWGMEPFAPQEEELAPSKPPLSEQLRAWLAKWSQALSSQSKLPAQEKGQAETSENQP
jgi:hypothetical protein